MKRIICIAALPIRIVGLAAIAVPAIITMAWIDAVFYGDLASERDEDYEGDPDDYFVSDLR